MRPSSTATFRTRWLPISQMKRFPLGTDLDAVGLVEPGLDRRPPVSAEPFLARARQGGNQAGLAIHPPHHVVGPLHEQ